MSDPTSRTRVFLNVIWLVMTILAFGYVLKFGVNYPWGDEWEFIPVLTGQEPFGPWLWAQHNEHRLPLPRLIYFVLFKLFGDFRAGMILQVLMLSLLAKLLLSVVRKQRNGSAWTDLFIPVGLLNWGHFENLLMGYQICFALVCGLVCSLAVIAQSTGVRTRGPRLFLAGVLLLALEACGASGLVFAIPVGFWLLREAWTETQQSRPWSGLGIVLLVVLALLYIPFYYWHYQRPEHHPVARIQNLDLAIVISGQYVSMGFGYAARWLWFAVAVGVGGAVLLVLRRSFFSRSWGVICLLLGALGLAAAVGVGRSGFQTWDMGLWSRYGMLAWPILFVLYLAATSFGSGAGKQIQPIFATLSLILLPFNMAEGWVTGRAHERQLSSLIADLQTERSVDSVVEQHLTGTGQEVRAKRGIPLLREQHIGVKGHLR